MFLDLRKGACLDHKTSLLFNQVALNFRPVYNSLVDQVAKKQANNVYFWTSELATRNTFSTDLFLKLAKIELVKVLLSSDISISLVYTDCKYTKGILHNILDGATKIIYKKAFQEKIKDYTNPILNYLGWTLRLLLQFFLALFTKKLDRKKLPQNIVLIDNFVFNDSFKNNLFNDHYYKQFFTKQYAEIDLCYVPTFLDINFFNYYHNFKNIRLCDDYFILSEDYISIQDLIKILLLPLKQKLTKTTILRHEQNLFPLFNQTYKQTKAIQMYGLMKYFFFQKLKSKNINITLAIDWYEGQVIDKAWHLGINTFYPEIHSISYQVASNHEFYLSYFPTTFELENKVLPQKMYVSGKGFISFVKEFCPEMKVEVAPSFRYAHVWKQKQVILGQFPNILVGFSFLPTDCLDILEILTDLKKEYPFLLKAHPAFLPFRIKNAFQKEINPNWKFVEGNFDELLDKSNLLISTNSSICLEALAKGIPVIIIGSLRGLTQNPIPMTISQKIWRLVYTAQELEESINYFMNLDEIQKQEIQEMALQIRADFFEPVTEEATRRFLNLPN